MLGDNKDLFYSNINCLKHNVVIAACHTTIKPQWHTRFINKYKSDKRANSALSLRAI